MINISPRHIEEATRGAINARRAGDYMRGDRAIPLGALGILIKAYPEMDVRKLVVTLEARCAAKASSRG